MPTNPVEVRNWVDQAKKFGHKFIISVCDTINFEDYPVYCKNEEELADKLKMYDEVGMQRINEIITVE